MVRILLAMILCAASAIARTTTVAVNDLPQALRSAARHDTLLLSNGTLHASGLVIDRPLTLIGSEGTVIDAHMKGEDVILVQSDSVCIDGLTIRNVKVSYVSDNAAIKVDKRRHVTVKNCTITNAFFAIYLLKSERCRVMDNVVEGVIRKESNSGNGIHCWYGRDVLIEGNTISRHRDGIYLEFMHHVTVTNNICENNMRYGLHYMFSDSCSYRSNEFRMNGAGVAVMYSSFVEMKWNNFHDNWGASTYGLLLKDIRDAHIMGNTFTSNSVAIYAEAASRILFNNNVFTSNGYALKMLANCQDNSVVDNTFHANTFEVTTNSKQSANFFDKNYWSSYGGYDLDKNGFGDVPHHPVRLYSLMIEQMPSSVILMHSAFINILDLAERVVPTLTPETLVDVHPRMKPPTK